MMTCSRTFDEALLTGFLDQELTQGDEQRVRIHLEDCERCRTLVADMQATREVSMMTTFKEPADDSWGENPRGIASRLSFGLGWLLTVVWVVVTGGYALYHLATSPENLTGKVLIFSGLAAFGLLLLSVVLDRLKVLQSDPYRKVQK
jgi:predicted anti-sigma-YlaC factor YlaD